MVTLEDHWLDRVLVGGEWVRPDTSRFCRVDDPATGRFVAEIAAATDVEVDGSVEQARVALVGDAWASGPVEPRSATLRRIADLIRSQADRISELESIDTGKPPAQAGKEVASAARVFDYYAGAAGKLRGSTIPIRTGVLNFTSHRPVGVVAAIVPWNFPFLAAAWKFAPALAAGCAVLLKPAPETPLSALALGDILRDAEVPAGRASILPGDAEVGRRLTSHPQVDHVSFTGSTATGKQVMAAAAGNVTRVSLELGGNNASIVFPDAPFDAAVAGAAGSGFGNAGQSCSARSRVLVVDPEEGAPFAHRFQQALVERAETLVVGHPREPATDMGPLISERHREHVEQDVEAAIRAGARCLTGGRRLEEPVGGHYYPPTVLADLERDNPAMVEEIFGPVVAVHHCRSEHEAIEVANGTEYGLAGSVWTQDVDRALRVTDALDVGMATINTNGSASRYAYHGPFGGTGQSGIGRELGLEGLELYLETKNVLVEFGGQA